MELIQTGFKGCIIYPSWLAYLLTVESLQWVGMCEWNCTGDAACRSAHSRTDRVAAHPAVPMPSGTIKVKVVFFASAKAAAGVDEWQAELPEGSKTTALRQAIAARFKLLGEHALELPLAINQQYVSVDADPVLEHRDEVALIPPISGG